MWFLVNAWREILLRVLGEFHAEENVMPEWLVNPETNRRLKLDLLYPQIGLAIRFVGLQGRERKQRPSLEEEEQQQARDEARAELCERHGVTLVSIDTVHGEPKDVFRELRMGLTRSAARLARESNGDKDREKYREALSEARSRLESLARKVRLIEDLKLYAELWDDRHYTSNLPREEPGTQNDNGTPRDYRAGMLVEHSSFGMGVVQEVRVEEGESFVTVLFENGREKTFAASLVADKLLPR